MTKYAENYLKYFGLSETDFIACEVCGHAGQDFHHIEPRSKFGKNNKEMQDRVENVMALCRNCHNAFGQIKIYKEQLKTIHKKHMDKRLQETFGKSDLETF